jgi:hypothetical protein
VLVDTLIAEQHCRAGAGLQHGRAKRCRSYCDPRLQLAHRGVPVFWIEVRILQVECQRGVEYGYLAALAANARHWPCRQGWIGRSCALAAGKVRANIGDERRPCRGRPIARPVDQVRTLGQFEHHWAGAGFHHHRNQRTVALGHRRFGSDPARTDRALRPQHHDGIRFVQGLFGDHIPSFASAQGEVPPDVESFRLKTVGEMARALLVLAVVGDENLRQAATPSLRIPCRVTRTRPVRIPAKRQYLHCPAFCANLC